MDDLTLYCIIAPHSFTAPKISSAVPVRCFLLMPDLLAATDPFTSIGLPFPDCHIVGIVQYIAFLDGLLSLSFMPLRFLHVFFQLDSACISLYPWLVPPCMEVP